MRLGRSDDQIDDASDNRQRDYQINGMALRQQNGRARHCALQFCKGDDRAGKRDGTNGYAQRHFNQACGFDDAIFAHIEGFGRQKRSPSDHHRGQTDKRVEGGDKLGHVRHGNAAGNRRTDNAANGDAGDNGEPNVTGLAFEQSQRRGNGDDHAGHAE